MIRFKEHLIQYLLLSLSILLMIMVARVVNDFFWRFTLVFAIASFYLGFGALHHQSEKSLNLSVVLDYLFIAVIILLVLFSIFV